MFKRHWKDTKRFETPRECFESQIKWASLCLYDFEEDGECWRGLMDGIDTKEASPEEMLEIALEHFEKFGEVYFEAFDKEGEYYTIGCWDENATCSRIVQEKNNLPLKSQIRSRASLHTSLNFICLMMCRIVFCAMPYIFF